MNKLLIPVLRCPSTKTGGPLIRFCASPLGPLLFYQQERFAGHSKWQNIKHVKASNDQKKGVTASRYSMLIRRAVVEGGSPDPKLNSLLDTLVKQASKANVQKTTIERAISKATNAKMVFGLVEVMTPGGAFIMCDIETDQLNRTKYDIKQAVKRIKG